MPPAEPPPSNALWLTFIGAWRDEAQSRGSKAAQTYSKAYRSLSACPIPFQHPCQTTQLVGIGPTIASRLEQELEKWCEENGEVMPSRPAPPSPAKTGRKAATTKKGKKADAPDVTADDPGDADQVGAQAGPSRKRLPATVDTAPVPKKAKATTKKPYVPQRRSGAYGLLLGLYSQTSDAPGGEEVYLTKAELVTAAQPLSDSDYLQGGMGTKSTVTASIVTTRTGEAVAGPSKSTKSFYTGWSSMKTLITKGYVYQTGNPPKFCLSEKGYQIAKTMAEADGNKQKDTAEGSHAAQSESSEATAGTSRRPLKKLILPGKEGVEPSQRQASLPRLEVMQVARFRYAYLMEDDARKSVLSRSDAASRPSRRTGDTICYHIRFPRHLSSHDVVVKHVEMIEEDPLDDEMLIGFLQELKADVVAPGLRAAPSISTYEPNEPPTVDNDVVINLMEASSDSDERSPEAKIIRRGPRLSQIVPPPAAGGTSLSRLAPPSRASSSVDNGDAGISSRHRRVVTTESISLGDESLRLGPSPLRRVASDTQPQLGESIHADSKAQQVPWRDEHGELTLDPITLPPESYTIHFVLDNRERHHFAHQRISLATALEKRGVSVEVRALELGDALWIARRKNGGGAEGDEVVLDYIVERKRLDDLTGSILDGRWRDQKFRLSMSGISQVLYVIEDHDVDNQMRRFGPQIQTALSSTQVVEAFFVERTPSLDASIDYLVRMDKIVRQEYEGAELRVLPESMISRSSFLRMQEDVGLLTTFSAFQSLNSKSASLTLRDVFGKMLLCIKGMSAEKVSELLEVWQTPRQLWEAYEGAQRDTLVSDNVNPPEQRKKIGPALSAKVASVFRDQSYP